MASTSPSPLPSVLCLSLYTCRVLVANPVSRTTKCRTHFNRSSAASAAAADNSTAPLDFAIINSRLENEWLKGTHSAKMSRKKCHFNNAIYRSFLHPHKKRPRRVSQHSADGALVASLSVSPPEQNSDALDWNAAQNTQPKVRSQLLQANMGLAKFIKVTLLEAGFVTDTGLLLTVVDTADVKFQLHGSLAAPANSPVYITFSRFGPTANLGSSLEHVLVRRPSFWNSQKAQLSAMKRRKADLPSPQYVQLYGANIHGRVLTLLCQEPLHDLVDDWHELISGNRLFLSIW